MQEIKHFFATEDKFASHSGIELLDVAPGWAKASMKIEPYHFNGAKTVHVVPRLYAQKTIHLNKWIVGRLNCFARVMATR